MILNLIDVFRHFSERPVLGTLIWLHCIRLGNRCKDVIYGWWSFRRLRTSIWSANQMLNTLETFMATNRLAKKCFCTWFSIWYQVIPRIHTFAGCLITRAFTFCHQWTQMDILLQKKALAMEPKEGTSQVELFKQYFEEKKKTKHKKLQTIQEKNVNKNRLSSDTIHVDLIWIAISRIISNRIQSASNQKQLP